MRSIGIRSKAFRIICFVLLCLCAVLQLKFALFEQMILSERTERLKLHQIRSPRHLTIRAKHKHLFEADFASAEYMLRRALTFNPYYVPAWLSLVTLYNDKGERQQANKIFDYIDYLLRNINHWRWDKALVAYQIGRVEILPEELRYIINHIPGKARWDALQLAFTLWPDPQKTLENVGLINIRYLFNYAVGKRYKDSAVYFLEIIDKEEISLQEEELLACIEMLLNTKDRVAEAVDIWRAHVNNETVIFNGNFENQLMQKAFGWRTTKDRSVTIRIDSGTNETNLKTLHINFKGWTNLNFNNVTQIIPVQGGERYVLTAEFKTSKITTDQRPYIEIYGYSCEAPREVSSMVKPNQEWEQIRVYFTVPDDCSAMTLRLRRNESDNLDSKLSGHLWVRNFNVNIAKSNITF